MPSAHLHGLDVLTIVGGKVVHATYEFSPHAPTLIQVLPEWSPVKVFGGYGAPLDAKKAARAGVGPGRSKRRQPDQTIKEVVSIEEALIFGDAIEFTEQKCLVK